jgi:hypothetical protein
MLCLQETDLLVQEVMLAEEQARGLHPHDRWDLSAELEGMHTCVDGIEGERAIDAGQLSQLAVEISNALADLGMLPVQNIPQLLKSAQEVLTTTGLLLERLWEAQTSGASPWD